MNNTHNYNDDYIIKRLPALKTGEGRTGARPNKVRSITALLIIGVLIIWALVPADWIHDVDAFYYPNKEDVFTTISHHNVGSVEACRVWATEQAWKHKDPTMNVGAYECGIWPQQRLPTAAGPLTVYAEIVRSATPKIEGFTKLEIWK